MEVFEMRQVVERAKHPVEREMPLPKVEDAVPVTVMPFVEVRPPTERPFVIVEVPVP